VLLALIFDSAGVQWLALQPEQLHAHPATDWEAIKDPASLDRARTRFPTNGTAPAA
jgi:hypothetical protein